MNFKLYSWLVSSHFTDEIIKAHIVSDLPKIP